MGTEFMKHKVATGVVWLVDRSIGEGVIRAMAFVAGCSGVETLAYLISFWIGLSTISALIASHEKLSETRSLLNNRILGTVLGIGIAIGIAAGTSQFGATVLDRGSVVILGALIGGSFHWAAEFMVAALMRWTGTLVQESASIRSFDWLSKGGWSCSRP